MSKNNKMDFKRFSKMRIIGLYEQF